MKRKEKLASFCPILRAGKYSRPQVYRENNALALTKSGSLTKWTQFGVFASKPDVRNVEMRPKGLVRQALDRISAAQSPIRGPSP